MPFHIGENTGCAGGTVSKERAQRNARAACSKRTRCQVQEEEAEDAKASAEGYTQHIVIINQSIGQSITPPSSHRAPDPPAPSGPAARASWRTASGASHSCRNKIVSFLPESIQSINQSINQYGTQYIHVDFFAMMRCVRDSVYMYTYVCISVVRTGISCP